MKRARCKRSAWFARNGFVRSTITWTTPSCGAPQLNGSLKRWPNVKSRETHYTRVLREDWSGAMVSVGSDGRDSPVVPGAVFPLVSSKEYIAKWETLYGKVLYQGAWNFARRHSIHGPYEIPPLPEGAPTTKPSTEDAAHFMVRMVHQYPHDVTIYAAGPMTDLALAIALDPHFPELTKELIVMGGSINPVSDNPEFALTPRREFNFWMDPEASHAVLHAHWPRFVLTTVDISVKTKMETALIEQIAKSGTPAAQYVAKYAEANILWDELAAAGWLDPSIITRWQKLYVDVEVDHGASYGDTHAWAPGQQPGMGESLVEVQQDLYKEKFYKEFVELMTRPTPGAHFASTKGH